MDDLYQYLISGAPTQDQVPAIVDQLRRRRSMGEVGMLTGDKVLAPFGQSMVRQSDAYAGDLQNIRQKDADNAQTKAYQDAQLKHMSAVLKQTMERDRNNAEHQRRADAANAARARAAVIKATSGGQLKNPPPVVIKELTDAKLQLDKVVDLKKTFKEDYALSLIHI